MNDQLANHADLFPQPVHEQLAAARHARGLSVDQVADETRIPIRHLTAIEAGEYATLPSTTYAVGFVRAVARLLGLDEVGLAAQLREELGMPIAGAPMLRGQSVAPPTPDRIPPRAFAWTAALLAVLILCGFLIWRSNADLSPPLTASLDGTVPVASQAAPPTPAAAPTGEVVLAATAEVWVRISDGAGKTLVARTLAPGERFAVPAAAPAPVVTVGRPEALTVTVGGREVAPLGPAGRAVRDVPVTAAALTARGSAAPAG